MKKKTRKGELGRMAGYNLKINLNLFLRTKESGLTYLNTPLSNAPNGVNFHCFAKIFSYFAPSMVKLRCFVEDK